MTVLRSVKTLDTKPSSFVTGLCAAQRLLRSGMPLRQIVLLSLAALLPAAAQEIKPQEIYQRLLPSIMTLHVENRQGEHFVGTAFLALNEGLAVTAWHVIADARKVTAKFADNTFVEVAGLVDKDEKTDLALIRLSACGRPPAALSLSNAPVGARVYVIGAPKGYDFSISDGLISQMQNVGGIREYQVSCPISGGNSGGPLVNERGEVIGVTSWSKIDAQNLNFAVPSSCITSLNASLSAKAWVDLEKALAANAKSAETAKSEARAKKSFADPGYSKFKENLDSSAGEKVTLVMVKKGRKQSFTFVVPPELSKE